MTTQSNDYISLAEFFVIYAQEKGWVVPDFHIEICDFIEKTKKNNEDCIIEVFRGAAKSTIAGVYIPWNLFLNNSFRFLVQSADDDLATMMTRDAREVLLSHPLCEGMLTGKPAEHFFWIDKSTDKRNPSVRASGIMSNVVGGRADEIIYDDVEVQKNVETPVLRQKLRKRMSEGTHIIVPQRRMVYIGTPHTEDSIYPELEQQGVKVLKIPLFKHNQRINEAEIKELVVTIPTDDLIVFYGSTALTEGVHYQLVDNKLLFDEPITGLIDLYSINRWPAYFTREEVIKRRKKCKTIGEWDSQYLLRATNIEDCRLNPDYLIPYEGEPVFEEANDSMRCTLNGEPIVSMKVYWDVALGKIKSDASVLTVLLQNMAGHYFWHRAVALTGDIHQQCIQIRKIAEALKIPHIIVETAGSGAIAPAILRKALNGTGCTVGEKHPTENKNKKIIHAVETPLNGGYIHAHSSIMNGVAIMQMRDWNPKEADQPDDYLDSLSGAILSSPIRIGGRIAMNNMKTFRGSSMVINAEYTGSF